VNGNPKSEAQPLRGNPKSEARNPKQIQRTKGESTKREPASSRFGFSPFCCFEFVSDFVLRISDFLQIVRSAYLATT
jgi:hypothetical protein